MGAHFTSSMTFWTSFNFYSVLRSITCQLCGFFLIDEAFTFNTAKAALASRIVVVDRTRHRIDLHNYTMAIGLTQKRLSSRLSALSLRGRATALEMSSRVELGPKKESAYTASR